MEIDPKKIQFDRFSADLPENVRKAIWDLMECQHYALGLCFENGQLRLNVNMGASCFRYLTLYDVSGVPDVADEMDFASLIKRGEEYQLVGEAWNEETEELSPFVIRFSHAKVESFPCRADEDCHLESPWWQLTLTATCIIEKYNISDELLNDGEKELLPLLAELAKLAYREELSAPWHGAGFPLLKAYVRDAGYPELLPAIEKVEKNFSNCLYFNKLIAKLDQVKYEPLFRGIWNKIVATQQEYPTASEIEIPHIRLAEIRDRVTKMMEKLGYSGTYPDFYKTGAVKGIHVAKSHGLDRVICGKKQAAFHIHCKEITGKEMQLMLFCGTQLLRKNQEPGDFLSCMFDSRGRTYAQFLLCEVEEPGRLEIVAPIADKLTQMKKLTREEREQIHDGKVSSLAWFFLCLILGGFCFAILCIPLMLGLDALVCWLAGKPVVLPDAPWLKIFFVTWLGFGSLSGALTAIVNYLK